MKKLSIYFKSVFFISIIVVTNSCRNAATQNSDLRRISTEKIDTHKVYLNQPHSLPKRPMLNDSINPPEFINGIVLFKDTIYSELIKIYGQRGVKDC